MLEGKPIVFGCVDQSEGIAVLVKVPNIKLLDEGNNRIEVSYNRSPDTGLTDSRFPILIKDGGKIDWTATISSVHDKGLMNYGLADFGNYYVAFPIYNFIKCRPNADNISANKDSEELTKLRQGVRKFGKVIVNRLENLDDDPEEGDTLIQNIEDDNEKLDDEDLADIKVKKLYREKRLETDVDRRKVAKSSVSVGIVRKTDADWDFNDGKASDDDDDDSGSDTGPKNRREMDSSDDEKETLSSYGNNVARAITQLANMDADQELEEDDEEVDTAPKPTPGVQCGKPGGSTDRVADRLETEDKMKDKLINYVRENPDCEFKTAIASLNMEIRGNRVEVLRNLIKEYFVISITGNKGSQTRTLRLKD